MSSSRSVARRAWAFLWPRKATASHAWAKAIWLVRPPWRWAASIGQIPSPVE